MERMGKMKYIARNIWGDGESTEIKTTGSGAYLRIKKLHFDMLNMRCLLKVEKLIWNMVSRSRTEM